jgi:hypothetical protein
MLTFDQMTHRFLIECHAKDYNSYHNLRSAQWLCTVKCFFSFGFLLLLPESHLFYVFIPETKLLSPCYQQVWPVAHLLPVKHPLCEIPYPNWQHSFPSIYHEERRFPGGWCNAIQSARSTAGKFFTQLPSSPSVRLVPGSHFWKAFLTAL